MKGETFVMPWYVNEDVEQRGKSIGKMDKVNFNKRVLSCLVVGGMFEFCGSVLILLAFSNALVAEMN